MNPKNITIEDVKQKIGTSIFDKIEILENECWNYIGNIYDNDNGRTPNRLACLIFSRCVCPIVNKYNIEYTCNNYSCVNPNHLAERVKKHSETQKLKIRAHEKARRFRPSIETGAEKCVFCGINAPGKMTLDHIIPSGWLIRNGIKDPNYLENLQFLCPLCQAIKSRIENSLFRNQELRLGAKIQAIIKYNQKMRKEDVSKA